MIRLKNLLFLLMLLPAAAAYADQGTPALESIARALSSGDADGLAKYFGNNVEISILDKEQTYSKTQGADVLRGFFNTNKPKSFSQVHRGTSRESSDQYCIGNLVTGAGNYRVYLYLKVAGSNVTVQEIRFDKE